jgi:hypothetical protein
MAAVATCAAFCGQDSECPDALGCCGICSSRIRCLPSYTTCLSAGCVRLHPAGHAKRPGDRDISAGKGIHRSSHSCRFASGSRFCQIYAEGCSQFDEPAFRKLFRSWLHRQIVFFLDSLCFFFWFLLHSAFERYVSRNFPGNAADPAGSAIRGNNKARWASGVEISGS